MPRIYKLLDGASWRKAQVEGVFTGSAVDERDGFIHFSNGAQAGETARLYFRDQADLWLLTVEAEDLGEALRWEASRGGAHFPHLYGPLALDAVIEARAVALDAEGAPLLGTLS